ncbi:chloramphenicol resistance protein [Clostridium estertheticum]|uniref:chloramphenicol resistance protein n=1 Tax=Clostridium estertheticum TaxID=238834 RepID=UPI0013EEAB6B|nr:chloramphenicol resistance protein [Clostridium estertheticum]MBZ9608635.1 chloramphenicol resistance protein [Clostridium estertheticum]
MIVEAVRNFIMKCPYLQEFEGISGLVKVNVDYLEENSTVYSIEEVPVDPVVKKYINGDSIRQFQFIFCSREPYGADVLQNISNSGFYFNFANWIEEQNNIENFPLLVVNCEATEIKVLSPGYAFQVDVDKARYQIELRLKYYNKQGGI